MMSKAKKYKFAIEWIAINDEPTIVQIDVLRLREKMERLRQK